MPGLASASVGLWVAAGGRHERPEQNGIAHFLEHMAFKGTKRRTALQIAEEIEDVGGYINAYTSREMTAYYARVLEADVPLAHRCGRRHRAEPGLRPERDRGRAPRDPAGDRAGGWTRRTTSSLTGCRRRRFRSRRWGARSSGRRSGFESFAKKDLKGFVKEHYGPDQMILAGAGAVDHDALVRTAEGIFGHLKPVGRSRMQAGRWQGSERREVKDLEQAHVALGFQGPAYRDEDLYVSQVYTTALGGGMSSRLFQKIREERGLCYSIYAQGGSYDDTGMITIYAGTSAEEIGDLCGLTIDEMKRAAEDMTEAEVARARAQMKAGPADGAGKPLGPG